MSLCAQIDQGDMKYLVNRYGSKDEIKENIDDIVYLSIHKLFREVEQKNELESPIYTTVFNEKDKVFEFIVTSSPKPYFRHTFSKYPKELYELRNIGGKIGPYFSENGQWLTAFTPVKDTKGNIICLLHVDQEFGKFKEAALMDFFKSAGISLVISLLFISVMVFYLRRITLNAEKSAIKLEESLNLVSEKNMQLEAANQKIDEFNEELRSLNENLELQVEECTKNLKKANEELDQFVYSASHNLRAPLSAIMGLIKISSDEENIEALRSYINLMGITSEKMDNIIKDIIDYSKNNRIELKPEPINVEKVANQAIEENMFNDDKIKLSVFHELSGKRNQNEFYTDRLRLKILLKNLISNAINHKDENKPECKVKVHCFTGEKDLKIKVTDNGMGMSADIQNRIFNLFFIGNPKSKGSGIGLYIVKEILAKLKGQISFETQAGKGTTFTVEIPELID